MKSVYFFALALLITTTAHAGLKIASASIKRDTPTHKVFTTIEKMPVYPGGDKAFYKYISKKLKYPDVALLIGIEGKVYVSFVIEKDGRVNEVTPIKCLGAGCDAAAAEVIEQSKPWEPGVQDGKLVRVQYTVPISFNLRRNDGTVTTKELRKSDYGFIFQIKGNIYSLDQAEVMLGKKLQSAQIEASVPYEGSDKYAMPGKKAVYIIVIKEV